MNPMDDWQLLRDYAQRNSEEAFRVLVDRYAGLVYHAALRQAGNPETAQDVAQAVFIALARKADRLPAAPSSPAGFSAPRGSPSPTLRGRNPAANAVNRRPS